MLARRATRVFGSTVFAGPTKATAPMPAVASKDRTSGFNEILCNVSKSKLNNCSRSLRLLKGC